MSSTHRNGPPQGPNQPAQTLRESNTHLAAAGFSDAEIEFHRLHDLVESTDAPGFLIISARVDIHQVHGRATGQNMAVAEQWIAMMNSGVNQDPPGDLHERRETVPVEQPYEQDPIAPPTANSSPAEAECRRLFELVLDTDPPEEETFRALMEAHINYAAETGEELQVAEQWLDMIDSATDLRLSGNDDMRVACVNFIISRLCRQRIQTESWIGWELAGAW